MFFFFQAEDGIRDVAVTGVQTCALPISSAVELERPRDPAHGDVATNLALTLAKSLKQKPRAVAERLVATLQLPRGLVREIEIAGPGFINFFLAESQLAGVLEAVLARSEEHTSELQSRLH